MFTVVWEFGNWCGETKTLTFSAAMAFIDCLPERSHSIRLRRSE